jgi:preprotein translocase subunit SecG
MLILVTIIHVIMCLALIAIVLLQTGKGADIGAAFGGASQTLFGGAGPASFLNRVTTIAAVVFMLTSFTLAMLSTQQAGDSIVDKLKQTQQSPPGDQQPAASQPDAEQNAQPPLENPSDTAASTEEKPANSPASQESSGTGTTGTESKEGSQPPGSETSK